nr:hypothetical protein [Klebsiella pneumoniae]
MSDQQVVDVVKDEAAAYLRLSQVSNVVSLWWMRNRQNVRGIQCVDSGSAQISAGERTERCSDSESPAKGIVAEKVIHVQLVYSRAGNSREAVFVPEKDRTEAGFMCR